MLRIRIGIGIGGWTVDTLLPFIFISCILSDFVCLLLLYFMGASLFSSFFPTLLPTGLSDNNGHPGTFLSFVFLFLLLLLLLYFLLFFLWIRSHGMGILVFTFKRLLTLNFEQSPFSRPNFHNFLLPFLDSA